jgi:hypothetical protein
VIEVVEKRTHGIAIISRQLRSLLRQPRRGGGKVRVRPVEGTRVDDEPGVGEQLLGDGGDVRVHVLPVAVEVFTLFIEDVWGVVLLVRMSHSWLLGSELLSTLLCYRGSRSKTYL